MPSRNPKRPPPFSLRLTQEERRSLEVRAGGEPLGSYIRSRLFDFEVSDRRPTRGRSGADSRKLLAQLLSKLGQSQIASNIDKLAQAVRIGVLPLTPETEPLIQQTASDIAVMKSMLMKALRIKEH